MNLHEAAEIVRERMKNHNVHPIDLQTATQIAFTQFTDELDPTPISEELVIAEGFVKLEQHRLYRCNQFYVSSFKEPLRFWAHTSTGSCSAEIKTLGELRTLLRLMEVGSE